MLEEILITKTLRVSTPSFVYNGDGRRQVMQLDSALMSEGFKLSSDLFEKLSTYSSATVNSIANGVLNAVRTLVGSHVDHNVYFRDFPDNIPDTAEFWMECLRNALSDPKVADIIYPQLFPGWINLLDLPKYGRYQHSYEEMVAAHEKFVESENDRLTILHLGKTVEEEANDLYISLAIRSTPLSESDRELLAVLAEYCVNGNQPTSIPVRENRALINSVRVSHKTTPIVDTVTDILRLAAAMSPQGDVTLNTSFKFRSFKRFERRLLLEALNQIISDNEIKLSDVWDNRELWKRLAEKLHPNEYNYINAKKVFTLAYADKREIPSVRSTTEKAFQTDDIYTAITTLSIAPGILFRNLDRLLRSATSTGDINHILKAVQKASPNTSGRVLLSVAEHLENRSANQSSRIFINKAGRAWATSDSRKNLSYSALGEIQNIISAEIGSRVSGVDSLVIDPATYCLAIPLSEKTNSSGFNIMPRGSTFPLDMEVLRFFCYWKQTERTTDLDLSVVMLNSDFQTENQVSWTNLSLYGAVHSGDIVTAPNGASEFIDIQPNKVSSAYVVPQVYIYSGEDFNETEQSFFGYMERTLSQKGKPFEAKTVKMKSDMRGVGRIALPLVFIQDANHNWFVKWVNVYSKGRFQANRVETNRYSTALLMKSIVERQYLSMKYLLALYANKSKNVVEYSPDFKNHGSTVFVGLEAPEDLTTDTKAYTLNNMAELIPN